MRAAPPRRRLVALLVLCTGLAGCGPGGELPWSTPQLEQHVSEPQRLILANDKPTPVTIETADGASSAVLAPGAKLATTFEVTTIAELEPSPRGPWYVSRKEGRFDLVRETTSPAFLRPRGDGLEILLRLPAGDSATASLSLLCPNSAGWRDAPAKAADHALAVSGLIDGPAGIPVRLCPAAP